MDIISRFDPAKAQKANGDTILPILVLPEGLSSPFEHAWGYPVMFSQSWKGSIKDDPFEA